VRVPIWPLFGRPGCAEDPVEALGVQLDRYLHGQPLGAALAHEIIDESDDLKSATFSAEIGHLAIMTTGLAPEPVTDYRGQLFGPLRATLREPGFFSSANRLKLPVGSNVVPGEVRGYYIDLRAKADYPDWRP